MGYIQKCKVVVPASTWACESERIMKLKLQYETLHAWNNDSQ